MGDVFLFLAIVFLLTFVLGRVIEKWRIPWIMAAIVLGAVASTIPGLEKFYSENTFLFLSGLGMYLLLFIIGFEIDLKEMTKKSRFLLLATFFIVCFEAILGSFLFHYALGYSWSISLIIGFSFATVGEEVLIPILEEFKMINTPLGRSIIGIGILDDIIEIFILVAIIDFVGLSVGNLRIAFIILSIIFLFLLTIWFRKAGEEKLFFRFKRIETLFLFIIFVLFLFLWIGTSIEAGPLAAFLAGISIKTFIPKGKLKVVEKQVKSFAYGFFAPLFFFHVGTAIDFGKIFSSFWLLIAVVFISSFAKILSSVLISIKELSKKEAIALGVGLSSRFSTGIVVIKILLDASLIDVGIYSVIMASGVIITFTVPIVFSLLVKKWKLKN